MDLTGDLTPRMNSKGVHVQMEDDPMHKRWWDYGDARVSPPEHHASTGGRKGNGNYQGADALCFRSRFIVGACARNGSMGGSGSRSATPGPKGVRAAFRL